MSNVTQNSTSFASFFGKEQVKESKIIEADKNTNPRKIQQFWECLETSGVKPEKPIQKKKLPKKKKEVDPCDFEGDWKWTNILKILKKNGIDKLIPRSDNGCKICKAEKYEDIYADEVPQKIYDLPTFTDSTSTVNTK